LACRWHSLEIPVSVVVTEIIDRETLVTLPDGSRKKVLVPFREEIDIAKRLKRYMNFYSNLYPKVVYCSKMKTLVVANPNRPTQWVNKRKECPYFTEV